MKTLIKMQFDPEIAKELGVGEAIMYANIEFWCGKNEANEKHFHDGHYWTYNSKNAFTELFPFWTERQIRTILDKLKERGYVKTGNYNKAKYDKTLWYTIVMTDKSLRWTKKSKGYDQKVQPIPDSKPNKINSMSATADEIYNSMNSSSDQQNRISNIFNFKNILGKMINDKQKHIQIVGIYWKWLGWSFENKEQYKSALGRDLKAASALKGYSFERIKRVFRRLDGDSNNGEKFAWNLNTVHKTIDNVK